jgi:hypothetical protein
MPSQERPDCPAATYHDISRDVFWKAKNAPGYGIGLRRESHDSRRWFGRSAGGLVLKKAGLSAVSQVASGRLFLLGQAWIGPFKVQKVPYR